MAGRAYPASGFVMPGTGAEARLEAPGSSGYPGGSEIIAGPVMEWMPAEERWRTYRDDEVITDPCLFEPVPVCALLDAVEADDAVAQALLDKGNRVLVAYGDTREAKGEAKGEAKAVREHIQAVMQWRGVAMDAAAHARIAACTDLAALKRWFERALYVASASALFDDD